LGARIRIHPLLQDLANGKEIVEVEGENVGKCLVDLVKQYPKIHENIFDPRGNLLKHIEIFINGKPAPPEELTTPVRDGDELSILMLLSGG
jgi:molybdopterin converting factor small subunit